MSAFLEERLPIGVRMGAQWSDEYKVQITTTSAGQEYRRLVHPYPARRFRVEYTQARGELWSKLLALYHRAYGSFAGFRVRAMDDFTTNNHTSAPTAYDETLTLVETGVYQLVKRYGKGATALEVGYPARTLFKPVSGTVLVGIQNTLTGNHPITAVSVNANTGRVTFNANKTRSITAITQATSAVVTVGSSHGIVTGDSVHFTGVVGMTQINGRRAQVTATTSTTITVNINTAGFSAYTSGGTVNTRPQAGETVTGGCEFDIPCRFDSVVGLEHVSVDYRETGSIEIVELLNP